MNFKMRLMVSAIFVVCLLGVCSAQDVPASFYFRCLAWSSRIDDLSYSQVPPTVPDKDNPTQTVPNPDYKETPVIITAVGRSGFCSYKKELPVYFVRHKGTVYKIVASVDLSQSTNLSLLFFQKTSDPDKYEVNVLPDDPEHFPGGTFRVLNLSHISVAMVLSKFVTVINPNAIQNITPKGSSGSRLEVQVVRQSDGQRQYSNNWILNKGIRYMIFLVDDGHIPNSVIFLKLLDPVDSAVAPAPE